MEMLWALEQRGHETVMLTDLPAIGRETGVSLRAVELGPKLSGSDWLRVGARWPQYLMRLRKALEAEYPYDVLLVHYKKEQLVAPAFSRSGCAGASCGRKWGPVPYPLRHGLARRGSSVAAADGPVRSWRSRRAPSSRWPSVGVDPEKVIVVPERHARRRDRSTPRRAAGAFAGSSASRTDAFVVGCISRFHPKKRNDVVVRGRDSSSTIHACTSCWPAAARPKRTYAEIGGRSDDRAHIVPTPGDDVADYASAFDVAVFAPSPRRVRRGRSSWHGWRATCISTGAKGLSI